ncbi:MAG: DNA topoisomerase I [Candidatus Aenigmarchaeota archaeon]|nr:DNA topoisomerase I [Candidatus Aenigmarchaeota archaeon]
MSTIIICEKPDAADHIAHALAEKDLKKKKSEFGVDYWEFTRGNKKYLAVAAVGHLFNLKQKGGKGWTYPIFDVEWAPSFEIRKKAEFSAKYFKTLQSLSKDGSDFVIACDFDNEGTVIGYNILHFIFGKNDAKRMKFSTLTKQDLQKSFAEMNSHLDFQNLETGLARHMIDFYYGINSSRALTLAIKKSSTRFTLLSAGRVQGPVLYMLAEREAEIKSFKPVPYWHLQAIVLLDGKEMIAEHLTDKYWKKDEADAALKNSKSEVAVVDSVEKKEHKESPPVPFNITSLQTEAYKLFGYSPQQTLSIAQDLYTKAYTSYPRTSSEKLPPQINYREILEAVSKIRKYEKLAKKLLSLQELKPTEGKRDDPAHEALHPTVEPPDYEKLKSMHKNIYDLIVRRFFSVFGEPAIREGMKILFNIGKEKYKVSGRRTIKPGWIEFYGPLAKFDEITLPDLKNGDKTKVKGLNMLSKETQPPDRYSQASVIKEMETRGLGTRATRSAILQTLYDRSYITDKSVKVTELGIKVAGVLKKYVPDFVDEKFTKEMEEDLERITEGKVKKEKVLEEAKKALIKICKDFKENEEKIGKDIGKAVMNTQEDKNTVGTCPNCGGTLKVLFSIFTKKSFVGCSSYNRCSKCEMTKKACKCECPICKQPKGKCADSWKDKVYSPKCSTGYPLPAAATIQRLDKVCEKCKTPLIMVYRKGKRPFKMCLSPECPTKAEWGKPKSGAQKQKKTLPSKKVQAKKAEKKIQPKA